MRKPNKELRQQWARIAQRPLDAETVRDGLEAIIAYQLFGEEIMDYGDTNQFIDAHRDVIDPLVAEAMLVRG